MEMSWQDIAALDDPVIRNLWITQRYHEFAVALRDGGLGEDATWCAFAVWASKTAGATIRREVLPARAKQRLTEDHAIEEILQHFNHGLGGWAVRRLSHDHLAHAVDTVTNDVSHHVGVGNALVFTELAPVFTALVDALGTSPSTQDELSRALSPTLSALPSEDPSSVAAAFAAYGEALFNPADRAALVLKANTLAVAHEQQRLQPAIKGALDAAITDTFKNLIERDLIEHLPTSEARRLLDELTGEVCNVLDASWDMVLTEVIMQLITATETFDLRRDVPPTGEGLFPRPLSDLDDTPAAPVVAQWDRTHGTGSPSGAHDWAVLEDRMNFIVNLFRSRQRDGTLFNPPFSPAQLEALSNGALPAGPL